MSNKSRPLTFDDLDKLLETDGAKSKDGRSLGLRAIGSRKPYDLVESEIELALDLAAEGRSIQYIAKALGLHVSTFGRYRDRNPEFAALFTRAREDGYDALADQLLEIAEDVDDVQRGRLKSDNLKWLISKRKPKEYGEKIDVNMTGQVSVKSALDEARNRIPIRYPENYDDAQVIETKDYTTKVASDSESRAPGEGDDEADIFS